MTEIRVIVSSVSEYTYKGAKGEECTGHYFKKRVKGDRGAHAYNIAPGQHLRCLGDLS